MAGLSAAGTLSGGRRREPAQTVNGPYMFVLRSASIMSASIMKANFSSLKLSNE
jgi:hypothetical protein